MTKTGLKELLDFLYERSQKEFREWLLEMSLHYLFNFNVKKLRKALEQK